MASDSLSRAFTSTRNVLAGVKPEQLDSSTPCKSWKVHQLINHMVVAPRFGISALQTGDAQGDDTDYAAGDYLVAYDETVSRALDAFSQPGALQKMVKLPFAEVPGAFLMTMVITDQFTHGWDLAKATGQSTELDPELAAQLISQAAIPDEFRGEDSEAPFGPARPAPAGATEADKLAAHLGRHV